jgi:hypothetical protein
MRFQNGLPFMLTLAIAAVVGFGATLHAAASDGSNPVPRAPVDWVNEWSSIPASRHAVKDDIERIYESCAPAGLGKSSIKVYRIDMNQDGLNEFVVDYSAFKGYPRRTTCEDNPCVGDDCFLVTYVKRQDGLTQRQVSPPPGAPACPSTAAANTTCRDYCPALVATCPALFRDIYDVAWNYRVTSWNFYTPNFTTPYGLPSNRTLEPVAGNGLVFSVKVVQLQNQLCNAAELNEDQNHQCVKFYQWNNGSQYLHDIWRPVNIGGGSILNNSYYNATRWDHSTLETDKNGDAENDYKAFRLRANSIIAVNARADEKLIENLSRTDKQYNQCVVQCPVDDQELDTNGDGIPDISRHDGICTIPCYKDFRYACLDVKNTSNSDYFVPNNYSEAANGFKDEFSSFLDDRNTPDGVEVKMCELRYTQWEGHPIVAPYLNILRNGGDFRTLSNNFNGLGAEVCSHIDAPCDTTVTVNVHRNCEASLGVNVSCNKCDEDTRINSADRAAMCSQTIICPGPTCMGGGDGGDGGGGGN